MTPKNIAVIGAGPAGLASALYLHRAGHSVVIFERFETAAPIGSGLMLQPTGLAVLNDLGLHSEIKALGQRIDRLWGTDSKSGRTVLDVGYGVESGSIRYGLAVNRAALFDVLNNAVKREAITIHTNCEIIDLEPSDRGYKIGGEDCDLVVDCSGGRSKLRHLSHRPTEPKPLPYGALWATLDWHAEGFEANALTQRYDKASVMIGVLPMGKIITGGQEMAAFFWSLKPETYESLKASGLESWKNTVRGYWPECEPYLDQINSFEDFTLARYGHHTLKNPTGRHIAFVGDSAHSASPQLGQGANMALLDAKAISHAVNSHETIGSALKAYAKSRKTHLRVFQALSWMFTPFYQSDSHALAFIRDRVVATIARVPPAPWILSNMVSGTLMNPFTSIGLEAANQQDYGNSI